MAIRINNVELGELSLDSSTILKQTIRPITIHISDEQDNLLIRIKDTDSCVQNSPIEIKVFKFSESARYGEKAYLISNNEKSFIFYFDSIHDLKHFMQIIQDFKSDFKKSVFAQRTDDASASSYFQFYGFLAQQQNMMQDYIRTSTYQKAIISNTTDFKDKVVLDVGAGSGILSFFATQAGAKKVYAVEASSMFKHCEQLVEHNKLTDRIQVIPGKIEEIKLPEQVDVIISEPMGYMLVNERMLETYLHAKKWLKPNGKMLPTRGDLHFAPFSDSSLYMEQINKSNFWYQQSFHGVDLSCLRDAAVKEYFRQPIVDTFDISICMAKSKCYTIDFLTANESDLHCIDIPFNFTITQNGEVHGLAFWFDVAFLGTDKTVWLSTSPCEPLSHWYQVLALIETPVFVYKDQQLTGRVRLVSNKRQSYDVEIEVDNPTTGLKSTNVLDLKNPCFHYTGQPVRQATGSYEQSPSQQLWSMATIDQQQLVQQPQLVSINALSDNVMNCVVNNTVQQDEIILDTSSITMQPNQQPTQPQSYITTPIESNLNNLNNGLSRQMNNKPVHNGVSYLNHHQINSVYNTNTFPINLNSMIGDYVMTNNLNLPGQSNQLHNTAVGYK